MVDERKEPRYTPSPRAEVRGIKELIAIEWQIIGNLWAEANNPMIADKHRT